MDGRSVDVTMVGTGMIVFKDSIGMMSVSCTGSICVYVGVQDTELELGAFCRLLRCSSRFSIREGFPTDCLPPAYRVVTYCA